MDEEISIAEFSKKDGKVEEYSVELNFHVFKPDGATRKLFDLGNLRTHGWNARIKLDDGLHRACP
jgi:GDP-L-fucose synthase